MCNICVIRVPEGEEKEKRTEEKCDVIIPANILELISNTKPLIPRSLQNTKQIKAKKFPLGIPFSNDKKSNILKYPESHQSGKINTLPREQKQELNPTFPQETRSKKKVE